MGAIPNSTRAARIKRIENTQNYIQADALHRLRGQIVKLYEPEVIESETLPAKLAARLAQAPGRLFVSVLVPDTGKLYYLPLVHSKEVLLHSYGNTELLRSRPCVIEYRGTDIETGTVRLIDIATAPMSPASSFQALDISGVL